MNTENKDVKSKSRRIWGWILVTVGVLLVLCGLSFLSILFLFVDPGDAAGGLIFGAPGLLIGLPVLVIGIRWIISGKGNKQDWGWVLTIVGWFPILLDILWIYDSLSSGRKLEISDLLFYVSVLLIGIFLVIIGIRRITQKGKAPNN